MNEWLDEAAAAEWLDIPEREVRQALEAGEIPALRIGRRWRVNKGILLDLARGGSQPTATLDVAAAQAANPSGESVGHVGLPRPAGLRWVKRLEPGTPWQQRWVQGRGKPDVVEDNKKAWEGTIELQGKTMHVKVGKTERKVSLEGGDQAIRARVGVFFDNYPTVEFVETADGAGLASLIKPDSRTTLALGAMPPQLYRNARLQPYRTVTGMAGQGVRNGMAIVIESADLDSAVHHAAARWLARSGFPLIPQPDQQEAA